jgi:hypothetical protein
MVLTAAAAAVLVGFVGIALRNRGDDSKASSSKDTQQALPAEAQIDTATADTVAGALPTIVAINGPADFAVQVNDAAQLLALAGPIAGAPTSTAAGDTAGGGQATTTVTPSVSTAGDITKLNRRSALACPLAPNQVVVADIIWIDTPAIAVRDTVTGVMQAIDDQCTVLVEATP